MRERLGQHLCHDFAAYVGKSEVAAKVPVSQSLVIQAEAMQHHQFLICIAIRLSAVQLSAGKAVEAFPLSDQGDNTQHSIHLQAVALEVLAHERYEELLRKANVINEAFVDYRVWMATTRRADGRWRTPHPLTA